MATQNTYTKNGLLIQCNTPLYPAPRPQSAYPIPTIQTLGSASSMLTLSLVAVPNQAISGVQVTSAPLPNLSGSNAAWTLYIQQYQGSPNPLPLAQAIPVTPLNNIISYLIPSPMAGSTINVWLGSVDGVQTTTYPLATITTPVDPSTTVNAITVQGQLALVQQWNQAKTLQTSLDADGVALGVSTTAYDSAITALSSGLVTAGAPSTWATTWPSTAVFSATGIQTSLTTWWGNIAVAQAALQAALNLAAANATAAGTPTAIGDGVTTQYLWGGGTVKINGVTTTAYTTASGVLTFTTAPALDALLQGVSAAGGTFVNSVNFLAPADQITLMNAYNQELGIKGVLDASAATAGVSSSTYDNAVNVGSTSLATFLNGVQSNWLTAWPLTTTIPYTGIMTSLATYWATIATARKNLETAILGAHGTTGTAGNASALNGYVQSAAATANTIVLRDSSGNINAVSATLTGGLSLTTNGTLYGGNAAQGLTIFGNGSSYDFALVNYNNTLYVMNVPHGTVNCQFYGAVFVNGAVSAGSVSAAGISSSANMFITGAVGNYREIQWQTSGSLRWMMCADSTAESGSNAGSNFGLFGYSDTGAYLGEYLSINRATGTSTFSAAVSAASFTGWFLPQGANAFSATAVPSSISAGVNLEYTNQGSGVWGSGCAGIGGILNIAPWGGLNNGWQMYFPLGHLNGGSSVCWRQYDYDSSAFGPWQTIYTSQNINSTYAATLALIGLQGCPVAYPGSTKPAFTGIITGTVIWMVGDNSWNVAQGNGLTSGGTCYTATGTAGVQATGWSAAQQGTQTLGAVAAASISATALATNISLVAQVIQTSIFSSGGPGYSGWGVPGSSNGFPVGWAFYGNASTVTSYFAPGTYYPYGSNNPVTGNTQASGLVIAEIGGAINFCGYPLNQIGVAKLYYAGNNNGFAYFKNGATAAYGSNTPWSFTCPVMGTAGTPYRVKIRLAGGGAGGGGAASGAIGGGAAGCACIVLLVQDGTILSGNVANGGAGGSTTNSVLGGATTLNIGGTNISGFASGLLLTCNGGNGSSGAGGGGSVTGIWTAGAQTFGNSSTPISLGEQFVYGGAGGGSGGGGGSCNGFYSGGAYASAAGGAASAFGPGAAGSSGTGNTPSATAYGAGGGAGTATGGPGMYGAVMIEIL